MNTWLTQKSFSRTAAELDSARLKLQMRQVVTMFDILTGVKPNHSKKDHPAVRMWASYEYALGIYGMMLGMEWSFRRGVAEADEFWALSRGIKETKRYDKSFVYEPPPWMREIPVLQSHRSNLIRRDQITYGDKWKNVPLNMPYIWPVVDKRGAYQLFLSRSDRERVKTGERVVPERYAERIVNMP